MNAATALVVVCMVAISALVFQLTTIFLAKRRARRRRR